MAYPYQARATIKFKGPPGSTDSLSLAKGDIITVLSSEDDEGEWLRGRNEAGEEGIFPEQFVEKLDSSVKQEDAPVAAAATPVATEPVKALPLPETKASSSPETTAPKPASFKDRIAAFNKPSGPPPPVKSKPPTIGRKPISQPVPSEPTKSVPAAQPNPASTPTPTPGAPSQGLSASDAKESIAKGGSLKDRIAALQGGFNAQAMQPPAPGQAAPPKPWKKPVPVPTDDNATQSETVPDQAEDVKTKEERPDLVIDTSDATKEPTQQVPSSISKSSAESPVQSLSPPTTLPMPAIPRRAGPPRRKAVSPAVPKEEVKAEVENEVILSQPEELPTQDQPSTEAGESRQIPLEERQSNEPDLQTLSLTKDDGGPKSPIIRETLAEEPAEHEELGVELTKRSSLQAPRSPIGHSRTSSSESLQPPSPMHKPSLPMPPILTTTEVQDDDEDDFPASRSPGSDSSVEVEPAMRNLDVQAEVEESPEEVEARKKEDLIKRMAAMGGMRIGAPLPPPPIRQVPVPQDHDLDIDRDPEVIDLPQQSQEQEIPVPPVRALPNRLPAPPIQPPMDDSDQEDRDDQADSDEDIEEAPNPDSEPIRALPPARSLPHPQSVVEEEISSESIPFPTSQEPDFGETAKPATPSRKPSLPPLSLSNRPAIPQARRYSQDVGSPAMEASHSNQSPTSPKSVSSPFIPRERQISSPTSPRLSGTLARQQSMSLESDSAPSSPVLQRKPSLGGSPRPPVPSQRKSMISEEGPRSPPLSPRMNSDFISIPFRQPSVAEEPIAGETEPAVEAQEVNEEDEEVSRRSRIAERMARLGGMKMGMFPVQSAPKAVRQEENQELSAQEPEQTERRALPQPSFPQGGFALPGISQPRPAPQAEITDQSDAADDGLSDEAHSPEVVQDDTVNEEVTQDDTSSQPRAPSRPPPMAIDTAAPPRPSLPSPLTSPNMGNRFPPVPLARPSGGHSRQSSVVDQAPSSPSVLSPTFSDFQDDRQSFMDVESQDSHDASQISTQVERDLPPPPEATEVHSAISAPAAYSSSDLITFSERIGAQIFAKARSKSKEASRWQGDLGPANFVASVLGEVPEAQQPTSNYVYGVEIWSSKLGGLPTPSQIRLGDVFVSHNAKIKSKGIGSQSYHLGSKNAPFVAIVSDDYDARKNKIRVFEVVRDTGRVEVGGHHLDHLKEGVLQVYRVTPRS